MGNLSDNIKSLRKKLGMTQEEFANEVGVKRSLIGSYEEGRAEPRLQTLAKIAEVLQVTSDALINLDLTKEKNLDAAREKLRILAITVDPEGEENIEMVPQKAAAGYLNGFADPDYIAELPKFKLPNLPGPGTYRAFEIHGDSMLPLVSGTIVIGKYVESIKDVKNGRTYVLITRQDGITYKRVFNYLDDKGKLFLVSDNKAYSGYEVDPIDIEEIWEAKAFISIQFPEPEPEDDVTLEKLTDLVLNLQDDINKLKKGIPGTNK